MGVGNAVQGVNATAGNATYTIQPGVGVEWIIHNLYWSGACNIITTNGTTSVTFASPGGGGSMQNIQIHLTNTQYLQITDTSASTNNMAYDGIQTV